MTQQMHISSIQLQLGSASSSGLKSSTCSTVYRCTPRPAPLHLVNNNNNNNGMMTSQQPPPPPTDATPLTAPPSSTRHRRRRSAESRSLMGCMSGQRSPTSPCYSRPPLDPASRSSRHNSQSSAVAAAAATPPLSVFTYASSDNEDGPLPKTGSVDSGVDVATSSGGSSEKEEDKRRPSVGSISSSGPVATPSRSRGRSVKSLKHSVFFGSSDQLSSSYCGDSRRQMTSSSPSSPPFAVNSPRPEERKQSPSGRLWRSISSSSLVRSLSRRRAASKSRQSGGESDGSHSKMSSVDTEDSDCESRYAERSSRRRRIDKEDSQPPSVTNSPAPSGSSSKHSRRRAGSSGAGGFLARSFRRTKSTPAEEFVVAMGPASPGNQPEVTFSSLPRGSRRRDESPRMTSSSRATSLSSMKRRVDESPRGRGAGSPRHVTQQRTDPRHCDAVEDLVYLAATLPLESFMCGRLICGLAMTDKQELAVVDLRSAYIVDPATVRLIRVIGGKGSGRLVEPIGVSAAADGRLAFSDHADQTVKVFSSRGHVVRVVNSLGLTNVGGLAVCRQSGDVYVAGTGSRRVVVARSAAGSGRSASELRSSRQGAQQSAVSSLHVAFQHPYSVTINHINDNIIVGDDYAQTVTSVSRDSQAVSWCWSPQNAAAADADRRPFFPSSICVDATSGHVFVSDLYNEKVYMLDGATGRNCVADNRALLGRGSGLRGGPAALCVDARHRLYVADEERTVHVFDYSAAIVATSGTAALSSHGGQADLDQQTSNMSAVEAGHY